MITAVVTTYNRLEPLKRCVDAIASNDQISEVVVVHDGPSKLYQEFCKSYVCKRDDVSIRWLQTHKWFGFPAPARNLGIALAANKLIGMCDDDDIWEIDWCSEHLRLIDETDQVSLAFVNTASKYILDHIRYTDLFFVNPLMQSSCLFNLRNFGGKHKLLYDTEPDLKGFEDYFLWLKLLNQKYSIKLRKQSVVTYANSPDSIRSSRFLQNYKILIMMHKRFRAYDSYAPIKYLFARSAYVLRKIIE